MKIMRFTADSILEARLLAEQEFGEAVEILRSRTFDSPSWGGLKTQVLYEITVEVPSSFQARTSLKRAPKHPVETEELSATYDPFGKREMRTVHGIRSNQEGNDEPCCRRLSEDELRSEGKLKTLMEALANCRKDNAVAMATGTDGASQMPRAFRASGGTRLATLPATESMAFASSTASMASIAQTSPSSPALAPDFTSQSAPRSGSRSAPDFTPASGHVSRPKSELERVLGVDTPDFSIQVLEEKLNALQTMLQQLVSKDNQQSAPTDVLPQGLSEIRQRFREEETPEKVVQKVLAFVQNSVPSQQWCTPNLARKQAKAWLEHELRFTPTPSFDRGNGPRIFVFLGPTGVGKTTTVAKLAASFALDVGQRKSVALFTLDTYRIGAANQLAAYAQIIETQMEIIYSVDEVSPALDRHQDKDIILVDTAGRCPKNRRELQELKAFVSLLPQAETFLALSATTRYSDLLDSIRCFREVGCNHLVFTKLDETNSIGPLVGLLAETEIPLAYITNGQNVPNDFQTARADFFAAQLFP